jgi:hypothetical protein
MPRSRDDVRCPIDKRGRLRDKTIAFRLSESEYKALGLRANLCGYRWKQDYLIDVGLNSKVTAHANPKMLVNFRRQLERIIELLNQSALSESEKDEMLDSVSIMKEILEAFAEK